VGGDGRGENQEKGGASGWAVEGGMGTRGRKKGGGRGSEESRKEE